ncbi:porin family protein [Mesonia sp. MT50]|uniref:Porin family protein n=1 Tax=Mesonia profundi TaxID=3070998 RepID=A0ABU0ZZ32_9FLAO|nr:porin family protein [Mesonia profundi]MDQ7916717.1 porin family protein [Mesonia profundi]
MKKLILSVAVAATSIFAANAQADSDLIQFGVKGGVNFANLTGDDIGDTKSRTSFHAGLVAEVPYSERFSLQGEVMYSGQGFDVESSGQDNFLDNDDNIEYQLDYIQVPIMAKYYVVEGLSVLAGPQIAFKINEEVDYQPNADAGDVDLNEAEDFEFGIVGGLEYKLDSGFFVQGRYVYGISKLLNESEVLGDPSVHNSVFQLGVGYMF